MSDAGVCFKWHVLKALLECLRVGVNCLHRTGRIVNIEHIFLPVLNI